MKKIIFLILLLTIGITSAQSYGGRIKQLKTAYITQQLELTTKEAREFWPVYDEYYKAIEEYRKDQLFELFLNGSQEKKDISEAQARNIIQDYTETETAVYQAKTKLISDLKSIISEVKIAKLLIAEKDFNKKMLERFRRRD
ncbi:hypothetical protein HX109_00990 [Galbibacter sp. BG1]|uniref:hypothetical protein n=1 Tax=Galbibacter sp. BG1 TaxID=1170699 RepID=UPI0015BADD15|nr:hypothetical protein [Galbibacter sp. BG1]QLE00205.1 hypothetical protein HX109_00990 [Galbibacter sp. BG1]